MDQSQQSQPQQPPSGTEPGMRWNRFREAASTHVQQASDKFNVKSLFLIHFSFAAWVMVGSYGGTGYLFHSAILLWLLHYAIQSSSDCDTVAFAIFVEASSFFLELSYLIFHTYYFSAAMLVLILHMAFRVLAVFALFKEYSLRGGTDFYNSLFGLPLRPSVYDDLERPHLSVPPHSSASDYRKTHADMVLPR